MTQNTSHAVMAQRVEPHDSLEDFPTPPWGTRALCEHVIKPHTPGLMESVWEPACNRGYMAAALAEYFDTVHTSDIAHYGWEGQQRVVDFLMPYSAPDDNIDWVITNPPFRLAKEFVKRGLEVAQTGVAVIVRSVFVESVGRWEGLFRDTPPWAVCPFVERVPMVKGRYDPKASTATSYSWIVWLKEHRSTTQVIWIPPCRKALDREEQQ